MNTTDLFYLGLQVLCILMFMTWMCFLVIKIQKQKYSYYYITVRYLFYKDRRPYCWLSNHTEYVGYLIQLLSLIFLIIGLISEISESTVFTKSWAFFVGNLLLGSSACFTLSVKLKNE